MGTDAILFAKKSKRCFDFDRLYNFDTGEGDESVSARIGKQSPDVTITRAEAIAHAKTNIKYWQAEGKRHSRDCRSSDRHRANWNRGIVWFANQFSEDEEFFVLTDSGYIYSHGYAEENGYVAIEQPPSLYQAVRYWWACWRHRRREAKKTPEQRQREHEESFGAIKALTKALEAGAYNSSPPADSTLKIEDLSPVMKTVTYCCCKKYEEFIARLK